MQCTVPSPLVTFPVTPPPSSPAAVFFSPETISCECLHQTAQAVTMDSKVWLKHLDKESSEREEGGTGGYT